MDHGEMIDLAIEFLSMGCNVVTVSYRGYGHSTGTPSEAGLRKDAQTVLDHVLSHDVLSSIPVVVYGQSLGGAVSIDLVYNNTDKISALIIENTFMSIPLLVKDFPQPLGSLSFLCTQRWPSSDRIQKIPKSIPVLMLGGDEDQVVPPKHMQGLWAAAKTRGSSVDDDEITEKHVGCFPHFSSKPAVKSGSDILRELDVVSGPADWRNGKDRFKLFAKRRHETTCYDPGYWPTIRSFLNDLPTSTSTTTASTSTATIS
ncbi:bem46 [Coprinopsis cinerea okayama7|uniref:Bem46 n=1 Tax=Coprinopsis cinerea (strain Okayama-7 / 130 / ATCC MYA-4618 / FGSC 9003) TaxID=240176 RepID=A8P393_COPC7|nr:bem46 [Coprinopsis cinerea okayama7\|eukprot:XP_001838498.2 bem46 [Coprinopsis cinerea okayama7\